MMKNIIAAVGLLVLAVSVNAQDLAEAKKMLRYEKYRTAVKMLTPIASSNPEAQYYLGLAQAGKGDYDAALATMTSLPEGDFKKAGLASVYYAQGKVAEGNSQIAELTRKVKRKEWLPYKLAGDASFLSDNQEAIRKGIENYDLAIEKNPNSNFYVAKGELWRKMTDGAGKAMTAYQTATQLDPTNSLSYSKQGELWYDARVYDSVLVLYNKAKQYDPENPLPYGYLADAYMNQGSYELAKENIEKFLELSDQTMEDQKKYLNILFLSKDYDKVITVGTSLIGTEVEKPYMYRLIGEAYMQNGDYDKALSSFNSFFEKQPKDKILYTDYQDMARIMLEKGDTAQSDEYLNKSIELLDSDSARATVMTANADFYKEQKDYTRAAQWYNKALPYSEKGPANYFWAGYMSYYAGNYDNAVSVLTQMEEAYPEEPSAFYWNGRAKMAKDESAETGLANSSLEKYLELTAGDEEKNSQRVRAMEYLATVAYNTKDYTTSKKYCQEILAIDPEDSIANQILGFINKM